MEKTKYTTFRSKIPIFKSFRGKNNHNIEMNDEKFQQFVK